MLKKTGFKLSIIIISLFIVVNEYNSEYLNINDDGEILEISNLENSFLHERRDFRTIPYRGLLNKPFISHPVFKIEINIED